MQKFFLGAKLVYVTYILPTKYVTVDMVKFFVSCKFSIFGSSLQFECFITVRGKALISTKETDGGLKCCILAADFQTLKK